MIMPVLSKYSNAFTARTLRALRSSGKMPRPMPKLGSLRFLLLLFADWVNRDQRDVIAYLLEENRVLRGQLGHRRLRFSDDQRRRLATRWASATCSSNRTSVSAPRSAASRDDHGSARRSATTIVPRRDRWT